MAVEVIFEPTAVKAGWAESQGRALKQADTLPDLHAQLQPGETLVAVYRNMFSRPGEYSAVALPKCLASEMEFNALCGLHVEYYGVTPFYLRRLDE